VVTTKEAIMAVKETANTSASSKGVAKKTAAKKTTAAKRTAAKKTAAKKTTATKPTATATPTTAASPTSSPNPVVSAADPSGAQPEDSKSATSIAEDILAGASRWSSGRERVELLKMSGHDPEAVRKEVNRIRGARRRAEQR